MRHAGRPLAELIRYVDLEEGYGQETLRGTARLAGDIEVPAVQHSAWDVATPS